MGFAALLAVIAVCGPANAAPLTGAVVTLRPGGGAIMSLSFAGVAPRPQIAGNGTANPTIVLANTTVSQTVPPALSGQGPIVSVAIAQTGSQTRVSLNLAAPAPLTVRPAGSTIFVDVAPATPQPATATPFGENFTSTTMPVAPGSQQTVVVPLKYADVSEIAGVLVAGSNVAPNDNFTPQQSNIGTKSLGGSFGGTGFGGNGSFNAPVPAAQNFGGGFGGQVQSVAQRLNDNVAIDRRLNAIILTGTPDVIAALRDTIDKLDVQVAERAARNADRRIERHRRAQHRARLLACGTGVVINGTGGGTDTATGRLHLAERTVSRPASCRFRRTCTRRSARGMDA